MSALLRRGSGIVLLLLAWEVLARMLNAPVLTPPSEIFPALIRLIVRGGIERHISVSMFTILCGWLIASGIGVALGTLIALSHRWEQVFMPLVDLIRPVAALTIFPALIIIFGLGLRAKIVVIFWTAWPAALLNTVTALRKVDDSVIEAARLDGADGWRVLWYVQYPLALPMMLTGLRIAMSGGWISLVSAEMLGSSAGLGYSILAYSQTFRFPEMYAVIIIIATIGLLLNTLMAFIQHLVDWENSDEEKYHSTFWRFNDRAAGIGLDSLRVGKRT